MTYIEKNIRLANFIPIKSNLSKKGDSLTLQLSYCTSNYKILDYKLFHTNAVIINTPNTKVKIENNLMLLNEGFNITKYYISYKMYDYNNSVYIVIQHDLEIIMSYKNLMDKVLIAKNLLMLKNI